MTVGVMTQVTEVTIVVADDSHLVRDSLGEFFAKTPGCKVIGMAQDGDEAVTMIRALRPQIVVLDISMPYKSGIDVLREIRSEDSETYIIMFTANPSSVLEAACRKEGANHFLCKTQVLELLDVCKKFASAS